MDNQYIYIGLFSVIVMTILLVAMLFYINYKKELRREERETSVKFSYMREYFEKQLYDINAKLAHDNSRWQEVNHLLLSYKPKVDEQYFATSKNFNSTFFSNFGIKPESIIPQKKAIFVLTPFYHEEGNTFSTIKNTCENFGFRCYRGDEEFVKGDIFSNILKQILESRFVIAILNGRNPNVFYELGIAQAIGKPTLLVAKNLDDVPFDLQSQNIIIYNNLQELSDKINLMLGKVLIEE